VFLKSWAFSPLSPLPSPGKKIKIIIMSEKSEIEMIELE
jgi:hypothetical protein